MTPTSWVDIAREIIPLFDPRKVSNEAREAYCNRGLLCAEKNEEYFHQ